MELDFPSIAVGLATSALGFIYFYYGKKQSDIRFMMPGMALMLYVYFIDSLAWEIGWGVILAATPLILHRL